MNLSAVDCSQELHLSLYFPSSSDNRYIYHYELLIVYIGLGQYSKDNDDVLQTHISSPTLEIMAHDPTHTYALPHYHTPINSNRTEKMAPYLLEQPVKPSDLILLSAPRRKAEMLFVKHTGDGNESTPTASITAKSISWRIPIKEGHWTLNGPSGEYWEEEEDMSMGFSKKLS